MTASLTNAAQQGTATQAPKTRKPRKASAFMILQREERVEDPKIFKLVGGAASVKLARAQIATHPDGEYIIVCIRGKFTVGTETAKVVKASK